MTEINASIKSLCGQGIKLLEQGQFDQAGQYFGKLAESTKHSQAEMLYATTHRLKAEARQSQPEAKMAIKLLEPLLEKDPENAILITEMAFAQSAAGNPQEAEKLFREALGKEDQILPNETRYGLAVALWKQGYNRSANELIDPGKLKEAQSLMQQFLSQKTVGFMDKYYRGLATAQSALIGNALKSADRSEPKIVTSPQKVLEETGMVV